MPEAKAASTGRTDGPLFQKPLPQSLMMLPYNQLHGPSVKQFFYFGTPSGGPTLRAVLIAQIISIGKPFRWSASAPPCRIFSHLYTGQHPPPKIQAHKM